MNAQQRRTGGLGRGAFGVAMSLFECDDDDGDDLLTLFLRPDTLLATTLLALLARTAQDV